MSRIAPERLRKLLYLLGRLRSLLPLALLAGGCAGAVLLVSSCGGERPARPLHEIPPLRSEIRVLLGGPVASCTMSTTGGYELKVDGRVFKSSRNPLPATQVTRRDGRWHFGDAAVEGLSAALEPSGQGLVGAGKGVYRGRLQLLAAEEGQLLLINRLELESYLAGVLGKELLPGWSVETYKALAVAARTFAVYHMRTSGASQDYDVGCDQAWQVYGGVTAETDKSWLAVNATSGQVLVCGPAGRERLFMAQYSACCGGTVNDAYVIRNAPDLEPLRGGQSCDDCRSCSRYRWGPVRIGKEDLCRAVAMAYPSQRQLGGVKEIRVAAETSYGRAVWLDVIGPDNSIRLRAEDLRLALLRNVPEAGALHSMNCRIRVLDRAVEFYDGRGFGHGVGLCQWGAQGKAEQGWNYKEILGFYYPHAKLAASCAPGAQGREI